MSAALQARLAGEIVRAVKIPVSVDFEAGYSDKPSAVAENLKPLIEAGISGINIEDGTDAPVLLAKKIEAIKKIPPRWVSISFSTHALTFTCRIWSPTRSPAWSLGPPLSTLVTFTGSLRI